MNSLIEKFYDVALRKESVDRNSLTLHHILVQPVALRKESVDRNGLNRQHLHGAVVSLSARRAWIEIVRCLAASLRPSNVALRKESVDRNCGLDWLSA